MGSIQSQITRRSVALSLGATALFLGSMVGMIASVNAQSLYSASAQSPVAQSSTPVTYVTEVSNDEIVIQITEGEFYFHGYLERSSGNTFVGHDEQVRVVYDRDTQRVVVINVQTGEEYYNYFFSTKNEGSL